MGTEKLLGNAIVATHRSSRSPWDRHFLRNARFALSSVATVVITTITTNTITINATAIEDGEAEEEWRRRS